MLCLLNQHYFRRTSRGDAIKVIRPEESEEVCSDAESCGGIFHGENPAVSLIMLIIKDRGITNSMGMVVLEEGRILVLWKGVMISLTMLWK